MHTPFLVWLFHCKKGSISDVSRLNTSRKKSEFKYLTNKVGIYKCSLQKLRSIINVLCYLKLMFLAGVFKAGDTETPGPGSLPRSAAPGPSSRPSTKPPEPSLFSGAETPGAGGSVGRRPKVCGRSAAGCSTPCPGGPLFQSIRLL